MTTSRLLLERLLATPDLERAVPRLEPEIAHRVIQIAGLESSAEFVAHLSPGQLSRVLDLDLWRPARLGGTEEFDANRFGVWIAVLMQSGAAAAADKLLRLDLQMVVEGFARHIAVADGAAAAPYRTLDGDYVEGRSTREAACEVGGYSANPRTATAWEPIFELLVFLESEHPDYFSSLMRGCLHLSNGPREEDGLHGLLRDEAQHAFDLAAARDVRREREGYVTPEQGAAFLRAARDVADEEEPPESQIARAYFRRPEWTTNVEPDPPAADPSAVRDAEGESPRGVVDVLLDAGVLASPQRLLPAGETSTSRLTFVLEHFASDPKSEEALAFLANALIAAGSIQGRPFTPHEAAGAVAATCNLGFENYPAHWPRRDLVTAFQIGWTRLHRGVCMYAAIRLAEALDQIACADRDIQIQLRGLRSTLLHHLHNREPWRARGMMEVVLMLDSTCWAALVAAIDECPVAHAAATAPVGTLHRIRSDDFEFVSNNRQIAAIRSFMNSLGDALTR